MFHVELRRFPRIAREFNLTGQELQERFVVRWLAGESITLDDRQWTREKTHLTIFEGPEVPAEERGLGRGWSTVTRSGEDVTSRVLEAAALSSPLAELKRKLLQGAPLALERAVGLVAAGRPSERLALSEQAVWELLHEGRLALVREGQPVPPEDWQRVLLDWGAWTGRQGELELRPR